MEHETGKKMDRSTNPDLYDAADNMIEMGRASQVASENVKAARTALTEQIRLIPGLKAKIGKQSMLGGTDIILADIGQGVFTAAILPSVADFVPVELPEQEPVVVPGGPMHAGCTCDGKRDA